MTSTLFSKNIKHFVSLESSNVEAEKWIANAKPEEGSVVLADFQTQGRGTGTNTWESAAGENLLLSLILYPDFLNAEDQFMLNKIIALSVKECVSKLLDRDDVKIKWPNDVYVGKLKISGILSRTAISGDKILHAIVGLGLNVNQTVFSSGLPNPVSLKMIAGRNFDIRSTLQEFLTIFEGFYEILKQKKYSMIDEEYLSDLYNYKRQANYHSEGGMFCGTIQGVSKYGHLMIEVNDQVRAFDMKEIQYIIE